MTEGNLIDQFRLREAERIRQEKVEEEAFYDKRASKTIEIFHTIARDFADFMIERGFPGGSIIRHDGEEYIVYGLYETNVGDGEVYYRGTPLSILIDGDGNVAFQCETEPDGHTNRPAHMKSAPRIIDIATNLEEYKLRPVPKSLTDHDPTYYGDGSLFSCAVQMLYRIEREVNGKNMNLLYHSEYVRSIRDQLIEKYFSDGYNFRDYQRTMIAKRTQRD